MTGDKEACGARVIGRSAGVSPVADLGYAMILVV